MRNRRCLYALALMAGIPVSAGIVKLVVERRESPASDSPSFGSIGKYERLSGHAYGELDPADPRNAIITDLQFAPRNARGRVEYRTTFTLLRPVDAAKASGVMIYDVVNRGNSPLPRALGGSYAGYYRDSFNAGDILVASGWQGDIAPREPLETIEVPIAHNVDGSPLTGPVLVRFYNMAPGTTTLPLAGGIGSATARPAAFHLDTVRATLNRRSAEGAAIVPVASSDWAFADCRTKPFPGTPDASRICLKEGFDAAYLYELVYTGKDPLVLGIGFAATRDLVSYLRHSEQSPVAGLVKFALGRGWSQSGNFIKTFLHLGFNQDESRRIVWDGAHVNIAGRQLAMNIRFASPGGAAGMYEAGSEPPLWWADYEDDARGHTKAGMLDRCNSTHTCPKIFETFGSAEFWGLRMSPALVGTDAKHDIPLPANVRRYYFAGVTHGGGGGGFSTKAARSGFGGCALADNPNPVTDSLRPLTRALIDWVTKGTPPPPSRYPALSRGELVEADSQLMGFPAIPGVPLPDGVVNTLLDYDFGSTFRNADLSGVIAKQPPIVKGRLRTLVPRVDADGNETSGIASVQLQAPLGTYLGWNITAAGFYKDRECGFTGGFVPFATTKAERVRAGDPRPSLEERYRDHAGFVAAVRAAAGRLLHDQFLLKEDADRLVAQAEASDVLR